MAENWKYVLRLSERLCDHEISLDWRLSLPTWATDRRKRGTTWRTNAAAEAAITHHAILDSLLPMSRHVAVIARPLTLRDSAERRCYQTNACTQFVIRVLWLRSVWLLMHLVSEKQMTGQFGYTNLYNGWCLPLFMAFSTVVLKASFSQILSLRNLAQAHLLEFDNSVFVNWQCTGSGTVTV